MHAAAAPRRDVRRRCRRAPGRGRARSGDRPGSHGAPAPSTWATARCQEGDVDITKADFLLSIGRGVEDKDNIERFEELAERARRDAQRLAAAGRRGLDARAPARSASRARRSSRASTWRSGSPARCSTSPGCAPPRRSSRSTPIPRRRSSASRTTARWSTCSSSPTSSSGRWASAVAMLASVATRPVFWHFVVWLKVVWYVLAVASVARLRLRRRASAGQVPARSRRRAAAARASCRGCCGAGLRELLAHVTIARRDRTAGWAHRRDLLRVHRAVRGHRDPRLRHRLHRPGVRLELLPRRLLPRLQGDAERLRHRADRRACS